MDNNDAVEWDPAWTYQHVTTDFAASWKLIASDMHICFCLITYNINCVSYVKIFKGSLLHLAAVAAGPFQSYVASFGSLKVFLQKKSEKIKINYVNTEPPTANHLTDSELTHRGIKLLSSSALVSSYTATPLEL